MSNRSEIGVTPAQEGALALLREGRRFLLTGHQRPDGDCVGAEAALADVLRTLGKEVWILNPDPLEPQFEFLGKDIPFRSFDGGDLPRHDVTVLLDCSELSRCGALAGPIHSHASKKLVIDHHLHEDVIWWDEAYLDSTASATGLLIHRIARELGVELEAVAAEGVFTSLVTDTGWFKYSNTDAETLRVAGELVASGVDPDAMYRAIYQRKRRNHPRETGRILSSLEYHADGRLAVVCLPRDADDPAAAADGDDAMDILRSVHTVEVVMLLRELSGAQVKLSARSKTDYDVNALARRFGGGGHRKASGATIQGSLSAVKEQLITAALDGLDGEGALAR